MAKVFLTLILLIHFNTEAQSSVLTFADKLYTSGNYTKAIAIYKTHKDLDNVYDKIAKAYIAIGNYGQGLANYKKAIDANPKDLLIKYEYAKLLTKTKKYKEAKPLFRQLIASDSLNPNYHYELGVVLEKEKNTTAIKRFQKTVDLDSTHQKAIFKVAKHHIFKRRFNNALRLIDKGLECYGNNVELISLKAQAFYFQNYYIQAIVWFEKLLDLDEKSEFIHEKLSLCYAQNSDYEEAIYHRKQALKYSPNDTNSLYIIGQYYERISNFEKAEAYITKALKIQDKSLSDEYQKLGTLLNRQKKYEKAITAFQKSLKEDSTNFRSEFFIVRTKDEFYADLDTKIKLYENFIEKRQNSPLVMFAKKRLTQLKEEKFIEQD